MISFTDGAFLRRGQVKYTKLMRLFKGFVVDRATNAHYNVTIQKQWSFWSKRFDCFFYSSFMNEIIIPEKTIIKQLMRRGER
jgi:hypothetical protein